MTTVILVAHEHQNSAVLHEITLVHALFSQFTTMHLNVWNSSMLHCRYSACVMQAIDAVQCSRSLVE